MNINDRVYTPRFCTVRINAIFADKQEAREAGYTEPTHYHENGYTISGKLIGENRMIFAAVAEQKN